LPRCADEQANAPGLVAVGREELRPGDLVFFNTLRRTFSHVGIYIGDNRFVHSPRPGKSVRTDDISFAYWAKRFTGARRVGAGDAVDSAIAAPSAGAVTGGD
jgi:cell wall-associated NlpC family hydrolase